MDSISALKRVDCTSINGHKVCGHGGLIGSRFACSCLSKSVAMLLLIIYYIWSRYNTHMTRIGLLSDTHGYCPPQLFTHFATCDQIWHAGDLGSLEVLDRLKRFKPLKAVYGNIDNHLIRQECPEWLHFCCEGVRVSMVHIGGRPGRYRPQVRATLQTQQPDLPVCQPRKPSY